MKTIIILTINGNIIQYDKVIYIEYNGASVRFVFIWWCDA